MENSHILLAGIAEAMRQGIADGDLRADLEPAEMARAFIAFQNGAMHLWLWDPTAFSLKDSAPRLADIFLRGILPRGGNG